ncbi:hypothetical protein [Paraburkholderia phytofirmans]|nr:hypothetical protein [Paraburkholderia phytofirmans]
MNTDAIFSWQDVIAVDDVPVTQAIRTYPVRIGNDRVYVAFE